ncbi:uncharacterized protein OCT59_014075 [Rhizophagus irregularis]|uniref:HECT-type E3 ubiquitin transferase n=1 Tax=Rhizophagus irregularis (strain DAOM 181602 / DAOM 197198 / MUCL 43194) TaxID=747089 RepID=U9T0I3_RHIID|nr:hypothetical protein OCT59_014075 [Rhizophagus irregularis]GBC22980.2 ubiquitin-protein ligase E3B isoform X1 [Rhizophagus irregularis DAOM 181602=DAOM 197198]
MFPFNEQNAKKQAFVENARAEREQREQQRIKQKQEQKLSQSAIVIQKTFRKHLKKKQIFENLRNLWDIDSGFSIDNDNSNENSSNPLEILLLTKLLFAFFNPKRDNARFSHLCRLILSTTSQNSSNKGDQPSKIVFPFHFLLFNENYGKFTFNLMKKILWQCVERIIGYANENNTKTLYLTGTEIRLMIYFLDPKFYIIKGNLPNSNSISTLLSQNLAAFHNFLLQKGFYMLIGSGMFLRVDSILNLKSRAMKVKQLSKDDEKKLNSTNLWISACLRCCLFLLDLNSGGSNLQTFTEQHYSEKNKLIMFIIHIMSVPCLLSSLDDNWLDMLKKSNIPLKIIEIMHNDDSLSQILNGLTGNNAIFLMGNIVELMLRSDLISLSISETQSNSSTQQFLNFIEIINSLLQYCQSLVSSKQLNMHYQYHPIFKWYSGKNDSKIPNSYFNLVIAQLECLWQRSFILKAFNHVLSFKSVVKDQSGLLKSRRKNSFNDKKVSLVSRKVTIDAIETKVVCRLYLSILKLLDGQNKNITMNLTYFPDLIPCLWKFLMRLGPKGNMEIFLSDSVIKDPEKEPFISILALFCICCNIWLTTKDDEELYDKQIPFSIENDIIPMSVFFNKFCFALLSHSSLEGCPPTIFESARKVLFQLHLKDSRRSFSREENIWLLIKDPKKSLPKSLKDLFKNKKSSSSSNSKDQMGMSFLERIQENDPISIKILNLLPHTIPFETRLDIFRDYLKKSIPNYSEATGIMIKVRRAHVLDDGYKQLGGVIDAKIKGRIHVKFINETGALEDGVDQGGPFKEFITQLIAEAFDPSYGLFAVTKNSLLYPNHQNTTTKIALYSFLGKMIARAIQEGILVDVQFARFFLSKMTGRAVFLEDLIGLDDELLKNIMIVKKYEGNIEDLGLYFAIDEEVNGKVISKDIMGGSRVTDDNKIQYSYYLADYKLNQQAKEQTRAFINGFQSMIPENWLRMFSPPELQHVLSGEDADWEVSDLRKYTVYHGGYFDQHISIRHFWSILEDMNLKDKSAFLKFVTSCSKPPLGGFKYLQPPFTIQMISDDSDSNQPRSRLVVRSLLSSIGHSKSALKGRLPMSSTCFNLLKLPSYSQKSVIKEKLKYAINSNTGFELA